MSCTDVASVLDSHRIARLGPAERAQLDAHLAACADCTAAWHAQAELAALRVPPVPAALLERALLASRLPQRAPARRARTPVIIGSVLLAGAAAAAVTFVSLREESSPLVSTTEISQPVAPAAAAAGPTLDGPLDGSVPSVPQGNSVTSIELVETGLDFLPMVRSNPDYPPSALSERLAGYVQLEFDVTAAGRVENLRVVKSSDPQFEDPAVRAVAQWRYLPRIVAGERAHSSGVQTIIRFSMDDPLPSAPRLSEEALQAAQREWLAFGAHLTTAMDRLAADDLRGVELQLDEMQALFGAERADLWSFYGYLYTVQRNYDRAIDAYERSVAIYLRSSTPTSGPWVSLANLYFARHQYDVALRTLLRPRQAAPLAGSRLSASGAETLIERLRALGVTEETL